MGFLLALIFLRPFLCAKAYPQLNAYFNLGCLFLFLIWFLISRQISLPKMSLFNYSLLLLIISIVISSLTSINLHASLIEIYDFIPSIAILYLMTQANDSQVKKALLVMIIAAVAISLYTVYQSLFGLKQTLDYLRETASYPYGQEFLSRGRAFGTFFSPDMLAGYLAMVVPLCFGLMFEVKRKRTSIFYLLSVICLILATLSTKSLGGILALAVSIGLFFFLLRPSKKIFLISMLCCLFFVLSILLIRAPSFFNFQYRQNPIIQRLNYWLAACRIIREFPFLGIGLGNFAHIYAKYKLASAAEIRFAHNSYLQFFSEIGFLGITAILGIAFSFLRFFSKSKSKPLHIGLLASGVAFLFHNTIDYDLYIPEVSFHWWIILGIAVAMTGRIKIYSLPQKYNLLVKSIIALLIMLVAFFISKTNSANIHFLKVDSLIKENRVDEAVEQIKTAIRLDPGYDFYHRSLAKIYEKIFERDNAFWFKEAEKEYLLAIKLNPYYPFHYRDLGLFYLRAGLRGKATSMFKKAILYYPTNPEFRNFLNLARQPR